MAHYSVTVCLKADAAPDVMVALGAALAPFGETSETEWDQGFLWDSWRIDADGFWVVAGSEEDPRLIHEGPDTPSLPGRCAGAPRALIDLSQAPSLGYSLAACAWDVWHDLARQHPPALPYGMVLAQLRREHGSSNWFDPEAVNARFEAQPLIQAFRAAHPLGGRSADRFSAEFLFHPTALIDAIGWNRENWVEDRVPQLTGGSDLLTLDGWWIETDGTANHGTCGSGCDHAPTEYNRARRNSNFRTGMLRYLEALPEDALMVQVRGHC